MGKIDWKVKNKIIPSIWGCPSSIIAILIFSSPHVITSSKSKFSTINTIYIVPPLNIDAEELDQLLQIVRVSTERVLRSGQ